MTASTFHEETGFPIDGKRLDNAEIHHDYLFHPETTK